MKYTAECRDAVLIKPETDVVASQAEALRATCHAAIDQGAMHLILDFQAVEIVDSLGFGVLISAHNTLHEHGGSLTMVNVSANILRLCQLMRLDKHFAVKARDTA